MAKNELLQHVVLGVAQELDGHGFKLDARTNSFRRSASSGPSSTISFMIQADRKTRAKHCIVFLSVSHPAVERVLNECIQRQPGMGQIIATVGTRIENVSPSRTAPQIAASGPDSPLELESLKRALTRYCLPFLDKFESLDRVRADLLDPRGTWPVTNRLVVLTAVLFASGEHTELRRWLPEVQEIDPEYGRALARKLETPPSS